MSSANTVSDGVKGCDDSKGEEVTGPTNTPPDAAHSSTGSQKRPTPSSAASVTLGARGKTTTKASEKVREILEKRRAARAVAEEKKKQEATAEQNTTVAKEPVGRDAGGDAKGEVGTVAERKEGIDASNQPDVKSETKAQATGDSLGGGTDKTVVKGDKQEQGEVTAQPPEHASEEHEKPTTVKDGAAANKPSGTSQQTTRKYIQHTGETNTAPVGADGSKEEGTDASTEVQNRPSEKEVGAVQKDVDGDVLTEKSGIQDKPADKDTIAGTTKTPAEGKAAQANVDDVPPTESLKATQDTLQEDSKPSPAKNPKRSPNPKREPREKRAPRKGGLNAFVEKKHTLEQRQGLLSNANKDSTNKLASAGAGSLFGRLAGDGDAKNRTANQKPPPREVPLEERQGKLETADKAKAKELESGAATRALFGRLAGEQFDNTTNTTNTAGIR